MFFKRGGQKMTLMESASIKNGGYGLIYCDPPWSYKDKCNSGKRGASHKYECLSLADLCSLPIANIAAENCLLAMWWVAPMPEDALFLIKAWGFKLRTMTGFTWHKTTKHGKDHFGMGHWTRANAENCLFATKGAPKRISASVSQIITSPVGIHSAKPAIAREKLFQLMGDVLRIELFARGRFEGWDAWGDQLDSI